MANKKSENIIIVSGEDTQQVKKEIKDIEEKFKKQGSVDIISFFAEEVNTSTVIDNCNMFSVFANLTIVKLYDFGKAELEIIAKYTDNPNPKTILVLISYKNLKDLGKSKHIKKITKNAKIIESKSLYENQIVERIHSNLKSLKLKYTNQIVDYILQQVGNVETEINKFFQILKQSGIKNKVTIEDIKEIETITAEKNLFSFIDNFFSNNIISAINSYKNIVNEGTPLLVLNKTIYNKTLLYIKYLTLKEMGKAQSEIMSEMKVYNQWYFNKIKNEANRYGNLKKFKMILTNCYNIERAIKSETQESVNIKFELFLTELKKDWSNI